jgi:hypothetical protein
VLDLHAADGIAEIVAQHHHVKLPHGFFGRELDRLAAYQAVDVGGRLLAGFLERDGRFERRNLRGLELAELVGAVFE